MLELEWVFYLLILVNIAFVNWPEQFMLSLNQKKIYKGIENTVVCHFDVLENGHSRPRIYQIAFGGQAPSGPAGGAHSAPPDL